MTIKFEVGQTYSTRSACDYDCVFSFTVVKRTAKTVTIESPTWGQVRRSIKIWGDVESILPLGSYSMAPVLDAKDNTRCI